MLKYKWRKRWAIGLTSISLIYFIYLIIPLQNSLLARDYSQVILSSDSTILRVFLNNEEQWMLSPQLQKNIPENLKIAVLTYEDQHFQLHWGVNPIALFRAAYINWKYDKIVSGGSTITMQLARMVNQNSRTYWNKLGEMFLATKLEAHLSKDEILTEYLSYAPYGGNIRGYLAASYRYFNKKPEQLTWAESALLAVLPNAPGFIFPSSNQELLIDKRNQILLTLFKKGHIDNETYELSLLEKIPEIISPFPLLAPHLTDRIHTQNDLDIVVTTIDDEIQSETDFFVKQHAALLFQMGIQNACALVIDNESGEVVSYVGSQDYHDMDRHGRVDGITAPRSSGSILKPFLYALSIDDGHILPQTLIKDVPTYFSSFSPNNASEKFSGVSPANEALIYSLNIPAVRLLNAYGLDKYYNQLKAAGIQTLFRSADEYGLPIILGGAEVTPWDMAKLYRGMANEGIFEDLHYIKNQSNGYQTSLVSPGASYLIMNEMKELIRPGLEFYWKKYSSQQPIAWKTGTSYGHRDAWAVGANPEWTIVVWTGNFDGESNKNLSGMRSAGPLLFNIFNALPKENKEWFIENPKDFTDVSLCKETGFYASMNCPEVIKTNAPIHMKPLNICPYHTSFYTENNFIVCSHCWGGNQQKRNKLKFTPDINYYLRNNGTLTSNELHHNPNCPTRQEQDVLQIIYPLANANVFIPKDFNGEYQALVSKVATQFPQREVFWYLNDELLGSTTKNQSFPLKIQNGKNILTVVDTEGNKDQVTFSAIMNN
jgi:penicillin-binding protein 1C